MVAPTRAACETIELALSLRMETVLEREHGKELREWAAAGKPFGIVAGTGVGKTLGIRPIAEAILEEPLRVGVVNREREATPETPSWNVVIVTTGIARRWFEDDLITGRDTIIVDEIHQTSAELELCLALGKRAGCRYIWLSATVDPTFYARYLESAKVLVTEAFDPRLKARVKVLPQKPGDFLDDRFMRHVIKDGRGVAVFVPTRAEVEQLATSLGEQWRRLTTAFYHGGEPIRVIRPFLEGEVERPWVLAMTAAGQSALNLRGLDTVVIYDARYGNVVDRGRNVLHRLYLGANEILQMAGRVHGRVPGGEVFILSDRDLVFEELKPGPPEFQLAGDAERVAITCAALGVDATELELPVPLDRTAYRRALALLTSRGLVDGGRLTAYGREVEAMPVDRPWGELLVHADPELVPVVAVCSNIDSLHRMTREERDLHGVVVSGSDHLTAYNLYAEAVNQHGHLGEVYGLPRHLFDEEGLAEWAERRGVLVKAIEDIALGTASVYRSLELPLPPRLPPATREIRQRWGELVARIMPFDLVIDEHTADGQEARVSKTSVAGSWGAVAGSLRYFADRFGTPRAAIEGTTLAYDLIREHATLGPACRPRGRAAEASAAGRLPPAHLLRLRAGDGDRGARGGHSRRSCATWRSPRSRTRWSRGRRCIPTRRVSGEPSRSSTSCGGARAGRSRRRAASRCGASSGGSSKGSRAGRCFWAPASLSTPPRWSMPTPARRSASCRRARGSKATPSRSSTTSRLASPSSACCCGKGRLGGSGRAICHRWTGRSASRWCAAATRRFAPARSARCTRSFGGLPKHDARGRAAGGSSATAAARRLSGADADRLGRRAAPSRSTRLRPLLGEAVQPGLVAVPGRQPQGDELPSQP